MKKQLLFGQIPDPFDPDNFILCGPWSFLNKEHIYTNWESLNFEPDPFANQEELAHHAEISSRYFEQKLLHLSDILNKINNTQFSVRFWRVLASPWFSFLIQNICERQIRINNLISKYGNENIKINLVDNNVEFDFYDTTDFVNNGILNIDFNEWLFTRLLEPILPQTWKTEYKKSNFKKTNISSQNSLQKFQIKSAIKKWGMNNRFTGVYGTGIIVDIYFSALLSNKKHNGKVVKSVGQNNEDINIPGFNADFESLIISTMPRCLKNIKQLIKYPLKESNGYRITGPNIYFNELSKLSLAISYEIGDRIITSQHGGNYGTLKALPFIDNVEYQYSGFITWGWKSQEDYCPETIPLPSPLLSKLRRKKPASSLLLVSTFLNLFSYRLDSMPQPLHQIKARQMKLGFISNLNTGLFEALLYRPLYLETGALIDEKYFKEIFPRLKFCSGNLNKELLRTKLLILDHPITTFNMAMALNIPTIMFWSKDSWGFCRQAKQYFEKFEKLGMLFHNSKEAADKANSVWENPEVWWQEEKIQSAVKDYAEKYCLISRNWIRDWRNAIKTL